METKDDTKMMIVQTRVLEGPRNDPDWTSLVVQWLEIHRQCRDTGSIPDPGRSHMPQGKYASNF